MHTSSIGIYVFECKKCDRILISFNCFLSILSISDLSSLYSVFFFFFVNVGRRKWRKQSGFKTMKES